MRLDRWLLLQMCEAIIYQQPQLVKKLFNLRSLQAQTETFHDGTMMSYLTAWHSYSIYIIDMILKLFWQQKRGYLTTLSTYCTQYLSSAANKCCIIYARFKAIQLSRDVWYLCQSCYSSLFNFQKNFIVMLIGLTKFKTHSIFVHQGTLS